MSGNTLNIPVGFGEFAGLVSPEKHEFDDGPLIAKSIYYIY